MIDHQLANYYQLTCLINNHGGERHFKCGPVLEKNDDYLGLEYVHSMAEMVFDISSQWSFGWLS